MNRLLGVLVGLLLMGSFTNQAFAHGYKGHRAGYIEICKAANPELTGLFRYRIHDALGMATATVALGTCTQPIRVVPGTVTVIEEGSLTGLNDAGNLDPNPHSSFLSATTTAVGPTGPLPGGVGFVYEALVPASPGGTQNVVTVTYENQLVTGIVEVCKGAVDGAGLSGSWEFTITGANEFSKVVTVPIGSCSAPVTVPAGKVKVQETGDAAVAVTEITATQTASNANAVLGPNLGPAPDLRTATVVAKVAAGDASEQTTVTMVNTSVRLKLCKYVDQGLTNGGPYPFTFVTSGKVGPNGPIAPLSLVAGTSARGPVCTVAGTFRAGTMVAITEGIVPGTKVGAITVNPPDRMVPESLSLANRTVAVVLGPGETVVTYGNIPALPGRLKLCKVADPSPPPIAPGTVFTFTVSSGATATKVQTPEGTCVIAGTYPFNATLSVVEAAMTNIKVKSIDTVPSSVVVLVDGQPVNTDQQVLTSVGLAARSAMVTIGENNITELTFVNVDPLPGATAGGSRPVSLDEPAQGRAGTGKDGSARPDGSSSQIERQRAANEAALRQLVARFATTKAPSVKLALLDQIASLKLAQSELTLAAKRLD